MNPAPMNANIWLRLFIKRFPQTPASVVAEESILWYSSMFVGVSQTHALINVEANTLTDIPTRVTQIMKINCNKGCRLRKASCKNFI